MKTSLQEVEYRYGKPYQIKPYDAESKVHIFLLPTSESSETPYLAVEEKRGKIQLIELTGKTTSKEISFCGLELGMKEKQITDLLGAPSRINQEGDYMHWDYAPFPFYFLMENKKLHSVTVKNGTTTAAD